MSQPAPLRLRVFLASPGDVGDERALALKAMENLEYDPFLRGRVTIEAVAWDKPGSDTPMLATMTPQEAISRQRPKPSECDIVVVILWSRLGTPLPPEYIKADNQPYRSGTEWEYLDAQAAASEKGRPAILLYRRTQAVSLDPAAPDFTDRLKQWQLVEAFFDEFRNPDGSIRIGVNEYDTPGIFEKKLIGHLREIIQPLVAEHDAKTRSGSSVAEETPAVPPDIDKRPLWEGSPFPGLRAFTEKDAPIYFGRGKESDGLIARLTQGERFIAVVGISGSGKSSLVAAGLLPRLKDNAIPGSRDWRCVRFTPGELGDNPFVALASGFKPDFERANRAVRDEMQRLQADPTVLKDWIEQILGDAPRWAEIVLFVDQMEELFTVVDPRYREPFGQLMQYAANVPRLRLVTTLRADFYQECIAQLALEELLGDATFPLGSPGVGALREMIVRPAQRAGLRFNPNDLPDRILDDTGKDPGALPLMAFALSELFERRADKGTLTLTEYNKFGGVQGAIGKRAERTFNQLTARAQASLGSVFRELVEVDSAKGALTLTRRRARLSEIAKTADAEGLVKKFIAARLLLPEEGDDGETIVEVSHEALMEHWERLRSFLHQDQKFLLWRSQIASSIHAWQNSGRDSGGLLRGRLLREAKQWMIERRDDLLDEELDFVKSSLAYKWRVLRWGMIVVAIIFAAIIVRIMLIL